MQNSSNSTLQAFTIEINSEVCEIVQVYLEEKGALGISVEDDFEWAKREMNPQFGEIFPTKINLRENGLRARLTAYFYPATWAESFIIETKKYIQDLIEIGLNPGEIALSTQIINNMDWQEAWKSHYQIIHIGKNIVICPVWEEYIPKPNQIVLKMDPGQAFGSGDHATTQMCLQLLEEVIFAGDTVLDVGCGTGILSIASAKLGAKQVVGTDIDPTAIEVAKHTLSLNPVSTPIEFYGDESLSVIPQTFTVVVANIIAGILIELFPQIFPKLSSNGTLILSGILKEQLSQIEKKLEPYGATIQKTLQQGDWIALKITNH